MLHSFLLIIGILIIAAVVYALVKGRLAFKGKDPTTFPYQRESHLLTAAERSFLGVLEQALGDQYRVMGKVRLADIIKVRSGMNGSVRQRAFNRTQGKHLDFVVCNPTDLAIQYVVELDDQSHERSTRQDRDEFVDQALQAAGVPVFHFSAKRSYVVADLQKVLSQGQQVRGRAQENASGANLSQGILK